MQNNEEHWIRSGGANVLKFHINAYLIIYQDGSKYVIAMSNVLAKSKRQRDEAQSVQLLIYGLEQ
jgi:hypothetical protein